MLGRSSDKIPTDSRMFGLVRTSREKEPQLLLVGDDGGYGDSKGMAGRFANPCYGVYSIDETCWTVKHSTRCIIGQLSKNP